MTTRYAEATKVPIEQSRAQIESLLRARGASGFASSWDPAGDRLEFLWKTVRIRFYLPRKDPATFLRTSQGRQRTNAAAVQAQQQHARQRWRALYLVIRAKLEAVESGISIIEEEFLAFIVDPATDRTVGEVLVPRITEQQQLCLPAHGDS